MLKNKLYCIKKGFAGKLLDEMQYKACLIPLYWNQKCPWQSESEQMIRKPDLSALIVNYQSSALAIRAVESILAEESEDFKIEVILVDNCSDTQEQDILHRAFFPSQVKTFFLSQNMGYGRGNNYAYEQSSGNSILIINPDTWTYPGALKAMVRYLAHHPDCAAVGPTYWDEEKTFILPPSEPQSSIRFLLVHLGHYLHLLGHSLDRYWLNRSLRYWWKREPTDVEMISGGCIMMRRETIERLGLFDPAFKLYFEDTDWCRRALKAGYRLVYLPFAEVAHFYNQSGQKRKDAMSLFEQSRAVYFRKYESSLRCTLFPLLNDRITQLGRTGKRNICLAFKELGALNEEPPVFDARQEGCSGKYLLQVSPGPLFIPAFGAFSTDPVFCFPAQMWKRLGEGRYFARWIVLPQKRIIGRWMWEKVVSPNGI